MFFIALGLRKGFRDIVCVSLSRTPLPSLRSRLLPFPASFLSMPLLWLYVSCLWEKKGSMDRCCLCPVHLLLPAPSSPFSPCFFWLILILPYTHPRLSSLSFSPVFILKCEPSCFVGLFFECFLPAVPIQNTLRGTLLRSESLSRKQRRRRKLNLDSHRKKKRQKPEKKSSIGHSLSHGSTLLPLLSVLLSIGHGIDLLLLNCSGYY